MQEEFLGMLEKVRVAIGRPIFLSSAYRCPEHNRAVGGSSQSYHLKGQAVDIVCISAIDRYKLVAEALKSGFNGIGVARQFVHIDNRQEKTERLWSYAE